MKQTAQEETLIRHMLKSGRIDSITEQRLRVMLIVLGAGVTKLAEKTVSKKSLLWSVILAVFPDMDQSRKLDMLLGLVGKKKLGTDDMVPDEITNVALKSMNPEDVKNDFEGLQNRIDKRLVEQKFKDTVERNIGERKSKEHYTPDVIKQLRPPWNCTLVLDVPRASFEAYYPAGRPNKSTSMKYDDTERSKLASLAFCVEYLWRNHLEKGRASKL